MKPSLISHSDIYRLPEISKFLEIADGYVIAATIFYILKFCDSILSTVYNILVYLVFTLNKVMLNSEP